MIKMMFLLFVVACLYILFTELKKIYMKKRAEDELQQLYTEREIIDMREEAKKLEDEIKKREAALYGTKE